MSIYRALNDEKGNPEEFYYTEEAATDAYFADIRLDWAVQTNDGQWVAWNPSITKEEHQAAKQQKRQLKLREEFGPGRAR